jgi:hypothetical protein
MRREATANWNKVTRLRPYHGAINKSHATTNKEQANNTATGKKNPTANGLILL